MWKIYSLVYLLLASVLSQSQSESKFDKQEALSWAIPRELRIRFPYYFTGYDENGSPVYIGEIGKWNFVDELKKDPASVEIFEKLMLQFFARVTAEGAEAPGGVGSIVIADLKNFKPDPLLLEYFGKLAKKFDEINQNPGLKTFYVINANKEYMGIQEKIKPYLAHSGDRVQVYGEDATKWSPDVLKYLQLDQTRLGANSEPISALRETLNRKIPLEVQGPYVYYLSGYSKRGQPVFIVPFGKWDVRGALEKDPQGMLKLGRLHDQLVLRWNREGIEAPGSPGSIVIMDFKGFDERQSSHNETVYFYADLMRRGDIISRSSGTAKLFLINSTPEWEKVYNFGKHNLVNLKNCLHSFGEDPKEWKPVLLKEISPDQLPEEYGGSKDYSPLKTYGSV